ncbi:MAG: DUF3623 family protein [Gemmatirosa sp.]
MRRRRAARRRARGACRRRGGRTASGPTLASERPPARRRAAGGAGWWAASAVVAFWWLATGVLVVVQRGAAARVGALAAATALGVVGALLVARNRSVLTPRGAVRSFFGGALLWLWVAATLYGGWVVGVAAVAPAVSGVAGAVQAARATLHNDVLGLAVLLLAWGLARGGANRTGVWTLALFWAAHQVAKVNLFLGVEHPGAEFLPSYLQHLARHFGPAVNSPALPVTVAAFVALAAWLAARARAEPRPWVRQGRWLLAALAALAALEHLLLGIGSGTALWSVFLAARGT